MLSRSLSLKDWLRLLCCAVMAVSFCAPMAKAQDSPPALTARQALNAILPSVDFENMPLSQVIDRLREISGANFDVDWKAISDAGIDKNEPVTLQLHEVRLRTVLSLSLADAAGGGVLTFYVDDDVIEITTLAKADLVMVTAVFYVEDLINDSMPFDPTLNVNIAGSQVQGGSGGGSGGGGGSSSILSSGSSSSAGGAAANHQKAVDSLIKLIERNVRPEIWRDNGGRASIEYFNGNLIITAPRSVLQDFVDRGR